MLLCQAEIVDAPLKQKVIVCRGGEGRIGALSHIPNLCHGLFLQPNPRPAAVAVDELNARRFKGARDRVDSHGVGFDLVVLRIKPLNRGKGNPGFGSQILLFPMKQSPCGPNLLACKHHTS